MVLLPIPAGTTQVIEVWFHAVTAHETLPMSTRLAKPGVTPGPKLLPKIVIELPPVVGPVNADTVLIDGAT